MAGKSAILSIRILSDAANAKQGLNETAGSVATWEKGLTTASRVATVALAGIGAAALTAAGKASDLAESQNAVSKVFGDAAGKITAFGEVSATSAGLSTRAFNELAVSTGSILTNMGLSADDAAASTVDLTQRAADMASVFNTDVGTAMAAINAGLRGEAEPLRAFGVGLSDAAVKAKAVEMGLYSGTGALDANAKALATQALIMEQTDKTAGDYAATADGLANGQRTLTAEWENAQAKLGDQLVPILATAVTAFSSLLTWVTDNEAIAKILIGTVAGLAAAVVTVNAAVKAYRATVAAWTVVTNLANLAQLRQTAATIAWNVTAKIIRVTLLAWTAAQWLLNVAMSANPIGLVVLAVVALVAIFVLAYKKSDAFREMVNKLATILKNTFLSAVKAVSSAFSTFVGWLKSAWDWIKKMITKAGELASKLNPLKALGNLIPGLNSLTVTPTAGTTGTTTTTTTTVGTINLTSTADPATLKRILEGYDLTQGRPRGAPLRVAW